MYKDVNWSDIKVDTPIYVRNIGEDDYQWRKRYFAKIEDDMIYAFLNGTTSWSSGGGCQCWDLAILATDFKK